MWVELTLFLVWLALPPAYVVVLGRYYVRRCELTYRLMKESVVPDEELIKLGKEIVELANISFPDTGLDKVGEFVEELGKRTDS